MSAAAEPRRDERTGVGDIAIVLHSHMPYVEGFGTYPFGEEWLFDAVLRSHLPVLSVAEDVTVSITPVLADQLEAPGVGKRLATFARELRLRSAGLDAQEMGAQPERAACLAEADRYRRALERLDELGGDPLAPFATAAAEGRIELIASTATHAILPLLATDAARRLQIETGIRSHCRRFGPPDGLWLPECAYEPGLEELLGTEGIRYFCLDQSRYEEARAALRPIAAGDLTAFTLDWEAIEWLWSFNGYPSHTGYADFHRKSLRGMRPWSIGGGPYDPEAAAERAREQAGEFAAAVGERLRTHLERTGRPGLLTFAIDTELLGHWWWEGPGWLEAALPALRERGVRPVTLAEAAERHPAEDRPLRRSSWGAGKDLRTWDSPPVADLAWGARRLELRLLREASAGALGPAALARCSRELLAVQASDWAFLDYRRQAGDYPYQRVLDHSRALFEAIDSNGNADPALRNLAPDLSLAPLFNP
jgi:1,4-alpha-glucan branching enzyme